jgi:hypothetical protein
VRCYSSVRDRSALTYLEHGYYCEQLVRYFEYFPRSQVDIILSEDLRHDTQQTLVQVMTWLGVDPEGGSMDLSVRSNESGTPKSRKFSQIIGSRHTWYHDMLRKVTSQRLRQTLAEKLIQLNTKRVSP